MTLGTVVVFARAPFPGRVKTRLVPLLGEEATLAFYRALLADSLDLARLAGGRVVLAHTPSEAFEEQARADRCLVQVEGTFGERMDEVLAHVHADVGDDEPYLILGADAPHVRPLVLSEALAGLAEGTPTSALGRCQAGGFYVLGFRGPPVPIRRAWEYPTEGAGVADLLRRAGRGPRRIAEAFDVDEPADFFRFVREIEELEAIPGEWVPPVSRELLHRWRESAWGPFPSHRWSGARTRLSPSGRRPIGGATTTEGRPMPVGGGGVAHVDGSGTRGHIQ